ncbi:MAG: hypothetical protein HS122_02240 [Opitutaceae bacterium]|nr:hypothetical protein [Opitutaceae bacterium]
MNFLSSSPHANGLVLSRCVALTLFAIVGSESAARAQPQRVRSESFTSDGGWAERSSAVSSPYLAVILPPALRFEATPPPTDPTLRLAAGAPPRPGGVIEEVAAENKEAAVVTAPPAALPAVSSEASTGSEPAAEGSRSPASHPPVAILHDDLQREVRPEDVLPYFQFPGSVQSAPAPAPMPASSATYRQR